MHAVFSRSSDCTTWRAFVIFHCNLLVDVSHVTHRRMVLMARGEGRKMSLSIV